MFKFFVSLLYEIHHKVRSYLQVYLGASFV